MWKEESRTRPGSATHLCGLVTQPLSSVSSAQNQGTCLPDAASNQLIRVRLHEAAGLNLYPDSATHWLWGLE